MAKHEGVGRTIGRYQVLRLLGEGGMGAVYLAHDPTIDRPVAIKVLQSGVESPEWHERFLREARAAGQLRHPNIVTVFDIGEHRRRPFIAMEYIAGRTFAELILGRAPITLPRKLEMLEGVCAGLACAHAAGLVHRDIKPANLIVDSDWTVKILDFGVAKWTDSNLTRPEVVVGTLSYMAPEQVLGGTVTPRADLFALCAVAYELLSYRRAFPAGVGTPPQPLSRVVPGIDGEIDRIVSRGLQWDAEARHPDMLALRDAFAQVRSRLARQPAQAAGPSGDATIADHGPDRQMRPTVADARPDETVVSAPIATAGPPTPRPASIFVEAEETANRGPHRTLVVVAATAVMCATGAWLLVRDDHPQRQSMQATQEAATGNSVMAPHPAVTAPSAVEERRTEPASRPAPRPGEDETAQALREVAELRDAHLLDSAVERLSQGLKRSPRDRRLQSLLEQMAVEAERAAGAARTPALLAAGMDSPRFREAKAHLTAAGETTDRLAAIRHYRAATRLFEEAAATPASSGHAAPSTQANPPAPLPTVPPVVAASDPPKTTASGPATKEAATVATNTTAASPSPGLSAEDEAAVRSTLERWRRAHERDTSTITIAQLEQLPPDQLTALEDMFLRFPARSVSLSILAVSGQGTVARAQCEVSRSLKPRDSRQVDRNISERVQFTLTKNGGQWRITNKVGMSVPK